MDKKQQERLRKINILMQELAAQMEKDILPKKENWVLWAMDKFDCSNRTAKEYIDIAFLRLAI